MNDRGSLLNESSTSRNSNNGTLLRLLLATHVAFSEVKWQNYVMRALEAAASGHNILDCEPPLELSFMNSI